MERIILKSKVIGLIDGKELRSKYRMVIFKRFKKWLIAPQQSFDGKFDEYSNLPAWHLSDIILTKKDEIYIDTSQKWSIKGLKNAVIEAINYI